MGCGQKCTEVMMTELFLTSMKLLFQSLAWILRTACPEMLWRGHWNRTQRAEPRRQSWGGKGELRWAFIKREMHRKLYISRALSAHIFLFFSSYQLEWLASLRSWHSGSCSSYAAFWHHLTFILCVGAPRSPSLWEQAGTCMKKSRIMSNQPHRKFSIVAMMLVVLHLHFLWHIWPLSVHPTAKNFLPFVPLF